MNRWLYEAGPITYTLGNGAEHTLGVVNIQESGR